MEGKVSDNIKQEDEPEIATTIPLFIKKLWKMVNDAEAEDIISWNSEGNAFIIHDQFQLITTLLPHYFKHNNLASFVRQLNFYNFHKVPNNNNEMQFSHDCFIKDMPEVLRFIKRKNPVIKQKTTPTTFKDQEVQGLLRDVKDLKGKHVLVDKELAMLKRENLALWNELNSLRVKYTKQSAIINMLIHFLITYIHSHQSAFTKSNIQVSTNKHGNNIKGTPALLEIGYKSPKKPPGKNTYTVLHPEPSSPVTYSLKLPENCGPDIKKPRKNIQDIKNILSMDDQNHFSGVSSVKKPQRSGITYSIKLPGQEANLSQAEIQRSLLDILKENEQLCAEDAGDILPDFDAENQNATDDIIIDNDPDSAAYTVSYPTESPQEVQEIPVTSPQVEPIVESPQENTIDVEEFRYDVPNTITKTIPIVTPSGTTDYNYTITYPNPSSLNDVKNINRNKINVVDHLILPNKIKTESATKLKAAKKSVKDIINRKPAVSAVKTPAQSTRKATFKKMPTTHSANMSNAEGTLLEILKENERLTNDELVKPSAQDLNPHPQTNIEKLISDDVYGNYYHNDLEDEVNLLDSNNLTTNLKTNLSKGKTLEKKSSNFNILENPREHLSTYVDSTQEEINMLRDILNGLTSSDFTDILNGEPNQISVDDMPVIDEEMEVEHVPTEETVEEYNPNIDSVDNYFNKQFLGVDV